MARTEQVAYKPDPTKAGRADKVLALKETAGVAKGSKGGKGGKSAGGSSAVTAKEKVLPAEKERVEIAVRALLLLQHEQGKMPQRPCSPKSPLSRKRKRKVGADGADAEEIVGSRVVFQIDIKDTKTGKTLKKGHFRGTIITNNPKDRKYTVRFDDGDERSYDYDKHPIERTIANDNEYVEQCNNTIDFMATLDLSEAAGAAESE
jgi:hypothetical protein